MKQGCIARTKTIQFTSTQQLSTQTKIQSYNSPSLNITKFLRDSFQNITQNDIYDIIQNTTLIETFNKNDKFGNKQISLDDIIQTAKS